MDYKNYADVITEKSFASKVDDPVELHILKKTVQQFLNNVRSSKQKKALGKILQAMQWFTDEEVFKVIKSKLLYQFYEDYNILKIKDKSDKSSSNYYIRRLINHGVKSDLEVINFNGIRTIDKEKYLVIVDDFIGTGDTIIDFIKSYYDEYKIAIVFHTISEEGYVRFLDLESKGKIKIIGNLHNIVYSYRDVIKDDYVMNFVKKVANSNTNPKYMLGYKKQGLLVTFNGKCPNNNLDLIWSNDILFNGYSWTPVLGRKIAYQRIFFVKYEVIKKHGRLLKSLFNEYQDVLNDIRQLKICLCVHVGYDSINELIDICGYDTRQEIDIDLEFLITSKFLLLNNETLFIKNYDIEAGISNMFNHVIIKEKAKLGYMKNKSNRDVVRMYRP
ncbi:hypothetical protein CI105_08885 [Candidatus Izimaplasma bacterium ZiA1]|uniref:phosphoribosyltransferase-like protein n=1 Tax=Candidatus Izimoplasma sp. ZiA1 TaxID=2024899 RepID=UPI000BAA85B1|nr:hypothetical protein CI105_08885 [Candidatus Izimaplasma bacterium ZiA1]